MQLIFDRAARRRRRDRAVARFAEHDFLRATMLDGIDDRLESVRRGFVDVLEVGSCDGRWQAPPGTHVARCDPSRGFARASGGLQCDEDGLPFADASFDLVVSAGVLDQVDDLPGALTLIRRALRPGGLFLGGFIGAGALRMLRAAFLAAEGERPVARFHPGIDVRAAGDLLLRAGFVLPVADTETLDVAYRSMLRLTGDLRGMAASNVLASRTPLRRDVLAAATAHFTAAAGVDGRTHEQFPIVFLTGWAPER